MDPFSLAVGISGIAALIGKTAKLAAEYTQGVNNAHEAASNLMQELNILRTSLLELRNLLRSDNTNKRTFGDDSALVTSTNACRLRMDDLYAKLSSAASNRLKRAMWPLTQKEHKENLETIRAFAQLIQFALSVDSW